MLKCSSLGLGITTTQRYWFVSSLRYNCIPVTWHMRAQHECKVVFIRIFAVYIRLEWSDCRYAAKASWNGKLKLSNTL